MNNLAKKEADEKAKKIADKCKSSLTTRSRKKCTSKSTSLQSSDVPQLIDEPGSSSAISRNSEVTSPMQDSVPQSLPDDDYDYECSECFGTYKEDKEMRNGAEWVQCGCGQWIHEDCIGDTVKGSDGTERICCNCVL